jgi:hypothetical protein
VYSRKITGRELTFGVSGLLYRANVLMYDHQTESLWSQVRRQAVAGTLAGAKLEVIPSTLTTWKKWRALHPDSQVLSTDTGYNRDYNQDPYQSYYESSGSSFFSFFKSGQRRNEAKLLVAGVSVDGMVRAYPVDLLRRKKTLIDTLAGRRITLTFNLATDQLKISDAIGGEIPFVIVYWAVWQGMYPETELFGGKP